MLQNKTFSELRRPHAVLLIGLIPAIWLLSNFCTSESISHKHLDRYQFESRQMGTLFRLVLYATGDSLAQSAADSAFRRVETLNEILSDYIENSELNRLAEQSGDSGYIPVSQPLFDVISKADQIARETGGAFDITVGPYVRLWRKIRSSAKPVLPDERLIAELGKRIDYRFVLVDSTTQSIALTRKNMQLDLGGIAKGYAADEVLRVLEHFGIHRALVDAGGDIVVGDAPPDRNGWNINIVDGSSGEGRITYSTLVLKNCSVATSGDLFQYAEIDGEKYSHIIDPKTGLGLTDQSMVTVVAPDGLTADSYASAVSVLGPEEGIRFVEKHPDTAARVITIKNGSGKVYKSMSFNRLKIFK